MEAIILAGGLGSRLSNITKNIPKPMVCINGKPFLEILLDHLNDSGFRRVVLSVGYLSEIIINHFGNNYKNIEIKYAVEETMLGTGGAINFAFKFCISKHVFILNGDTFMDLDYKKILSLANDKSAFIPVIVSRYVNDVSRYGYLKVEDDMLKEYKEKIKNGEGLINAGCYLLPKNINLTNKRKQSFSFESDSIPNIINNESFMIYEHEGIFIDIGIPEDLRRAQTVLENLTSLSR